MLVGFLGNAGSGKSTAADFLVHRFGFTAMSLADPIKQIAKRLFSFTDDQLWGPSENRNKPDGRYPDGVGGFLTPRKVLQFLGTEVVRSLAPDLWVDLLLSDCSSVLAGTHTYDERKGVALKPFWDRIFKSTEHVVIPDVRFRNEVRKIQSRGGVVIRLNRHVVLPENVAEHPSEKEQMSIFDGEVDYVLNVPEGTRLFKVELERVFSGLVLIAERNSYDRADLVEELLRIKERTSPPPRCL